MTEQEVLNISGPFIYKQGKPSSGERGECLYRNEKGLACAIGACITDEEYDPRFDRGISAVKDAIEQHVLFKEKFGECRIEFLQELQRLHDNRDNQGSHFREKWFDGVNNIAKKYNLVAPVMEL